MDDMWVELIIGIVSLVAVAVLKYLKTTGKISDATNKFLVAILEKASAGQVPGVPADAAAMLKKHLAIAVQDQVPSVQAKLKDEAAEVDPDPAKKKRPVLSFLKDIALSSTLGIVARRFK